MTVQELIDELLKVEDKSKVIDCEDPQAFTYDIHNKRRRKHNKNLYCLSYEYDNNLINDCATYCRFCYCFLF